MSVFFLESLQPLSTGALWVSVLPPLPTSGSTPCLGDVTWAQGSRYPVYAYDCQMCICSPDCSPRPTHPTAYLTLPFGQYGASGTPYAQSPTNVHFRKSSPAAESGNSILPVALLQNLKSSLTPPFALFSYLTPTPLADPTGFYLQNISQTTSPHPCCFHQVQAPSSLAWVPAITSYLASLLLPLVTVVHSHHSSRKSPFKMQAASCDSSQNPLRPSHL